MDREKIKLSAKELKDIVFEDSDLYNLVESEIIGTFRYGNENSAIVQRISDNKYFELNYRDSIKDECDFEDLNGDNEYEEVFPETVNKTIYK